MGRRQAETRPASEAERRELVERVEAALRAGHPREAVETAKELVKRAPSRAAEELLVTAYVARVRNLLADGLEREAVALCELVESRFPRLAARLRPVRDEIELLGGGLNRLLSELVREGLEPARQAEYEAVLAGQLRDPAVVANSPALPEGHPLKIAASAVADLFTRVTSGPLEEDALKRLDVVSRRSPLAPWKLLIRALHAFHTGDDAAARSNLEAIAESSAVSTLRPVLLQAMGTSSGAPQDENPRAEALLIRLTGERRGLARHLRALDAAVSARDEKRAAREAREAMTILERAGRPRLKALFVRTFAEQCVAADFDGFQVFEKAGIGLSGSTEVARLLTLALEKVDPMVGAESWLMWLSLSIEAGYLKERSPETSRVLVRAANLMSLAGDDVDGFDSYEDDDADSEDHAFGRRPRLGGSKVPGAEALLKRALAAYPTSEVYEALLRHHAGSGEEKKTLEIAERWHAADPASGEALNYLIDRARRSRDFDRALELVDKLRALDPLNPEMPRTRFAVLVDRVVALLRLKRTAQNAFPVIDALSQEPYAKDRDMAAFVLVLRRAAARKAGRKRPAEDALAAQATVEAFGSAAVAETVTYAAFHDLNLEPPLVGACSPDDARDALRRSGRLFEEMGWKLGAPLLILELAEHDLPENDLPTLLATGSILARFGRYEAVFRISRIGLLVDGPLLPDFLILRAGSFVGPNQVRAIDCLRAAEHLARRQGNDAAAERARSRLAEVGRGGFISMLVNLISPEGTSDEEADEVLRQERSIRSHREEPRGTLPPRRGRPKKKAKRPTGHRGAP